MSFFGSSPQYDYLQDEQMQEIFGQQQNFNPWGYMPSLGKVGRGYLEDYQALRGGADPYTVAGLQSRLAALAANYGTAGKNMFGRSLATGDAALANSGALDSRMAENMRELQQQKAKDATSTVAGYQSEAAGGYQQALNAKRGFGLQAAGIKAGTLADAANTARNKYIPPTSYSPSMFDTIMDVGGKVAGAAAGVPGLGGFFKTAAPGGAAGGGAPTAMGGGADTTYNKVASAAANPIGFGMNYLGSKLRPKKKPMPMVKPMGAPGVQPPAAMPESDYYSGFGMNRNPGMTNRFNYA